MEVGVILFIGMRTAFVVMAFVSGIAYISMRLFDVEALTISLGLRPPQVFADFIAFELPEDFTANVFAQDLPGVRVLVSDPLGTVIASLTSGGAVVALSDEDGDGVSDHREVLLEGLDRPHGLALDCGLRDDERICDLYVAEIERVVKYSYDSVARTVKKKSGTTVAELPFAGIHRTRTIILDKESHKLFVSIGSSCAACEELDRRYTSIQSVDLSTRDMTTFASGLYNAVFMTLHPVTNELWVSEMGRDGLGDDLPPDEVNRVREGEDHGWPFCYGDNVVDAALVGAYTTVSPICSKPEKTPSTIDLPAHSAPLGIAFIPQTGWPDDYAGDLLVVYHGPASARRGDGHRVIRIDMDDKGTPAGTVTSFVAGFVDGEGNTKGQPAALLVDQNGSVLVSDDISGAIYRVSWRNRR